MPQVPRLMTLTLLWTWLSIPALKLDIAVRADKHGRPTTRKRPS